MAGRILAWRHRLPRQGRAEVGRPKDRREARQEDQVRDKFDLEDFKGRSPR